jgi:allophanate hydrolase subunit 2
VGLIVIRPGLSSTIQDRGRPGYREFGVPEGGAFDRSSLALANALLGNDPSDAAIELTMTGGRYGATVPLPLALAGAPMEARIETAGGTMSLEVPQSFTIRPGEQLVVGGLRTVDLALPHNDPPPYPAPQGGRLSRVPSPLAGQGRAGGGPRSRKNPARHGGLRAYLAVRGGWKTTPILGSRSSEIRLVAGQEIAAEAGTTATHHPLDALFPDPTDGPIRLLDGPDGPAPSALIEHDYRVAPACDRVGLRLDGPAIEGLAMPERPSAPVAAGAVQVAGGRILILGVAGGTMGGYPHVAHVISADVDRLGQAAPGQEIRFIRVGLEDARRLDRERRASLAARDRRIALLARAGARD